jgi:hypothetical protein
MNLDTFWIGRTWEGLGVVLGCLTTSGSSLSPLRDVAGEPLRVVDQTEEEDVFLLS